MKLSAGQRAALELLAKRRCYTAYATYGNMNVNGQVARNLVKKELARYIDSDGFMIVEITEKGLRVSIKKPIKAE